MRALTPRTLLWLVVVPLLLAFAAAASSCGGPRRTTDRTYTLQGQVLSVAPERKETLVKHETIAGLMEAMTMPYYVRDVQEISHLRPGDLITSTLVIEEGGAVYLRDIKKVGDAPLARSAAGAVEAPDTPSAFALNLLHEGDPAPNAEFIDQDGKARDFASFRGSTVVVTFTYTTCPLPTFCPLIDRHFATIQSRLTAQPGLEKVQLATISIDPEADTPAVLKRHAASIGANPSRWTLLTGDRTAVEAFAARFGVSVMREPNAADIIHNLRTAIVHANGRLAKVYSGNDWTPDQLIADLIRLDRSS